MIRELQGMLTEEQKAQLDELTFERFRASCDESPFRERFRFVGWVPTADVPNYYFESDLGLNVDSENYETTFGAGLPVLHTLKELVATGDELRVVEGCFSGTLGFLSTRLDEGATLADAVREARALGYTEPDPSEDLSGRDVARKALIVARALGFALEPPGPVRHRPGNQ